MASVKITAIGNSVGIVLSKEILNRLRVDKGDLLYINETPHGFQLSPYDADLAHQMDLAESIMKQDRDVLKRLAE